jgi:hypothetical protein
MAIPVSESTAGHLNFKEQKLGTPVSGSTTVHQSLRFQTLSITFSGSTAECYISEEYSWTFECPGNTERTIVQKTNTAQN